MMTSNGLFPITITIEKRKQEKQEKEKPDAKDAKGIVVVPFWVVSEEEQKIREENDRQRTMAICLWDRRW